ncbi:MAG: polyphosphate kinase 1 [Pyrinomonadaceae bacterium]
MTEIEPEKLKMSHHQQAIHEFTNAMPLSRRHILEHDGAQYINRDLSLLEFFRRVLEEAQDPSQPLLERLKFISILSSNLDEFFMIRVSGLKERQDRESARPAVAEDTEALLSAIRSRIESLVDDQMACLRDEILPELSDSGVVLADISGLSSSDREHLDKYFCSDIYPLLTPQAVDPTHPFPYISGGSVNIGLFANPQIDYRAARKFENKPDEFFVRIKIPPSVPAFIPLPEKRDHFVRVEDLVTANIASLVPSASPRDCHLFRITRDADIEVREAETEDLLEAMEENLKLRRFGDVVRLEVSSSMPDRMVEHLSDSLNIELIDVYTIDGPLNAASLFDIYKVDRPELKDAPIRETMPPQLEAAGSMFDAIKANDILLHHPYMPYSIVTKFIEAAAEDPDVLAIKMCLYRIGADSPIAPLLIKASERGKQVTVLIEIKARFDEENNIEWAKKLEQAGVHVVYGMIGLKTHCKTTLVIRCEDGVLKRYVHVATGNYNPVTSAFYTDLSLMTCRPEIGEDATELFNYLTVYSKPDSFKQLVVAPLYLRQKMVELICREAEHAAAGRPARIIAKMNRLADSHLVDELYRASQAGVEIDLIVRGICTLRPGVPGLSENIRVRSVVGRLLEHSRVYHFENGGSPEVFTGSSDWMPRNLDRRVEVLTPVHDPAIRNYLTNEFLYAYRRDNTKARELQSDGSYAAIERQPGDEDFNSQLYFQPAANVLRFDAAS